jgi:membrane associated rhomboid family serine protease
MADTMVRRLINEFRQFPASMTLCTLWVVVFVQMVLQQAMVGSVPGVGRLVLGIRGGHAFGELTIGALLQGEIWRPLTATFIHYGLFHIGMNLYVMHQLGPMIETWYGPWQFLGVYVLTGYGGNLFSALVRHAFGSDPAAASGGGSTVVLGLVALCAVVGWRSRTRTGAFVRNLMVGLLVATALLGLMVPIIDNWGHAGGALIGAAIGFLHRTLIRTAHQPVARWVGGISLLLLFAAGVAQARQDRIEKHQIDGKIAAAMRRIDESEQTDRRLQRMYGFYIIAGKRFLLDHSSICLEADRRRPSETAPRATQSESLVVKPLSLLDSSSEEFRAERKEYLDLLDARRDELGSGPTAAAFVRLRALVARVLDWPAPSERSVREFWRHLGALIGRVRQNQASAQAELQSLEQEARLLGWDLRRPARSPAELPAGAGDGPPRAAVQR